MRSHLSRDGAARRLADEAGSAFIEVLVSALVMLVAGAGVLKMMDRGSELNGQQKALATAGNLAQSEHERLRGYALSKEGMAILSNLRGAPSTRPVANISYTVTSRADWINDDSGDASCATAAPADYLKITTVVTSDAIGRRKPVTLVSLVTPPVRAFGPNQGSLAVQVNGRDASPIAGLTMHLTGGAVLSDPTNADGCVLWGYLPAGSLYTISASRNGYVDPSGSPTIVQSASVSGDQTANVNLEYDLAGAVAASFTTKRSAAAAATSAAPQKAMLESSHAAFIPKAFALTGAQLDTGLVLFAFTDPYTIYAGGCAAAKPPLPGNLGSAVAPRGSTSSAVTIQIPALNILVKNNGANVSNAVVKVTSCGTVYSRHTLTDGTGLIDDPGLPYGNLAVCVSNGTRKREISSVANTTYPATNVTYDVGTSGSAIGSCP